MKRFGWKQWLLVAAFALVVLATGLFAVRTFRRAVYWRLHRDEVIRPWMSIPYVAHSYHVPPKVLYEALAIDHPLHDRRPLRELSRQQNRSVDDLISILQNAIARERASQPPDQPSPPLPGRSP
jgi:hypothetical protein